MSNKLLLIFPKLDLQKDYHHIPYSSLALAAPLINIGIDFEIYDERVQESSTFFKLLQTTSVVGITMYTGYQTSRGYDLLRQIKNYDQNIITIVGGPHVTSLPSQTAACEYVDYAVTGFAEGFFSNLVSDIIEYGQQNSYIEGIYHSLNNKQLKQWPQKVNKRIDKSCWFPLPFNKIEIHKYINPATKIGTYITQYGCAGKCTFCATSHTRKLRQKPLNIIKTDLENLINAYPFEILWFSDASLFCSKKRSFELLNYFDKFKNIKWVADVRADELIKYSDDELIEIKNAAGGLIYIVVGLESGSTHVAEEIMKKGKNHLDIFREAVRKCSRTDLNISSGLIFGVPGETSDDLLQTIKYVREIRELNSNFRLSTTFFRPLPGTELFKKIEKLGFINAHSLADWADQGASSHFLYNTWMDIPWMEEKEKIKYKKHYHDFLSDHGNILV